MNRCRDLGARAALTDPHERRDGRRSSEPVIAVTGRALLTVEATTRTDVAGRRQTSRPHKVVGVHIIETAFGIERLPAPFRSSVEPRKDDRLSADRKWLERTFVAKPAKLFERPRPGLRRPRRHHVLSKHLPGKRLRLRRDGLRIGSRFSGHVARRKLPVLNWKQWLTVGAIKDKDVAVLGRLRDGVNRAAVAFDRDETGRRRRIAIPDVVPHDLKVPDTLAGLRVERDEAVGVEVVAKPVAAVEIRRCRTGRDVHDSARRIERHARPVVCPAVYLPGILRPRLVPGFTRMRDRVKNPAQFARAGAVRAHVTGRRRQTLADAATDDQQVLVDDAWRRQAHRLTAGISPEIGAQIDAAVVAKRRNRLPRARVERIQILMDGGEDSLVAAIRPVHEPAICALALDPRIERPEQRAGIRP